MSECVLAGCVLPAEVLLRLVIKQTVVKAVCAMLARQSAYALKVYMHVAADNGGCLDKKMCPRGRRSITTEW